jgi:hypothetical protein
VVTTNAGLVCRPGWASAHRHVTARVRARVFARCRLARMAGVYRVDHLISLELGGSNAIRNLWPEPYATARGARAKDRLENRLHEVVCAGRLTLVQAQRAIATDWIAAYRSYVGPL